MQTVNRRHLIAASAALVSFLDSSEVMAQTSLNIGEDERRGLDARLPRDVGRKFHADGSVKTFKGNTFLGHLPQQGEGFSMFDAFVDVYREFPRYAFHERIALLPPSSYHITVFGGLNDVDRNTHKWVESIPRDMPIEDVTQRYLKALKKMVKRDERPFEFVVRQTYPDRKVEGSAYIPMEPADKATDVRLRKLRDELAELTGIRRPDHDVYEYHVTLGYIHQFLNAQEAEELQSMTTHWIRRLADMKQKVRLPHVEYCRLRDMYAFEVLHTL